MQRIRLAGIDTNLLVALHALLEEQNVHRAAVRLGLSRSATSHALGRLRELFGDALLVKAGRRMTATPRALLLQPQVASLIARMDDLLEPPPDFDPAQLDRSFTIASTDYLDLVLLDPLMRRLAQEAPRVRLRCASISGDMVALLRDGELDLVFSAAPTAPDDVQRAALFEDGFSTLLRAGHPASKRKLTAKRFAALSHILVSPVGSERGLVDAALAKEGLTRNVAMTVSTFLTAPHLVARSDHVATLSSRFADAVAPGLDLVRLPPPVKLPRPTIYQWWHQSREADPAHRWLRDTLTQVASELD